MIFVHRFEAILDGFHIIKEIHVLVKATEDIGAQSWSKTHTFVISRHQKIKNLSLYIFLIIFKTNLPYDIDRIFLN